MLRLIVMVCILITSIQANAVNWKEVAKSEDLIATYYVDSQSIKRVGKFLYVTEMVDYSELQSTSSSNWKSDISIVRYDCAKTNSLLMALKLYEQNKGRGKLLANYKNGNEKDSKLIASDTVGALVYDYVCHTKIY